MKSFYLVAYLLFVVSLTCPVAKAAPVESPSIRVHRLVASLNVQLPPDWHFITLNEVQWLLAVKHHETDTAFSQLPLHLTYIREEYARDATDKRLLHTLAHEIGHYKCQCQDESTANKIADQLIQDSH